MASITRPATVWNPLLQNAAAAAYLGVASDTLRVWSFRGVGPAKIKLPGGRIAANNDLQSWHYPTADLEAFARAVAEAESHLVYGRESQGGANSRRIYKTIHPHLKTVIPAPLRAHPDVLLTTADAARYLGLSDETLRHWVLRNIGPERTQITNATRDLRNGRLPQQYAYWLSEINAFIAGLPRVEPEKRLQVEKRRPDMLPAAKPFIPKRFRAGNLFPRKLEKRLFDWIRGKIEITEPSEPS